MNHGGVFADRLARAIRHSVPVIYALRDPRTGRIRYVGKTVDRESRIIDHISQARLNASRGRATRKEYWILQLDRLGLRPTVEVLEVVTCDTWEERERRWIAELRALGYELTNIAAGGNRVDVPRTPEQHAKIGVARRGWVPSAATRDRMSAAQRATHDAGCRNGHAWTAENTIWYNKGHGRPYRACRTCRAAQCKASMSRDGRRERRNLALRREIGRTSPLYCKHGHFLHGENVQFLTRPNGKRERICRTCVTIRSMENSKRRRAKDAIND